MADKLALLMIGAASIAYVNSIQRDKGRHSDIVVPSRPSLAREVDVTRWKHDGFQPTYWKDGNQSAFDDETVISMMTMVN